VRGLLADVNFAGQLDRLMDVLLSPEWIGFWNDCGLVIETFADLGLDPESNDRVVWERCQAERLLLITGNRNDDGQNSLEAAVRGGPPDALPVLTVSDPGRVIRDGPYARAVALALLEVVTDIIRRPETVLGSGRVYLPKNPLRR
jgi:hypothetical protein